MSWEYPVGDRYIGKVEFMGYDKRGEVRYNLFGVVGTNKIKKRNFMKRLIRRLPSQKIRLEKHPDEHEIGFLRMWLDWSPYISPDQEFVRVDYGKDLYFLTQDKNKNLLLVYKCPEPSPTSKSPDEDFKQFLPALEKCLEKIQ